MLPDLDSLRCFEAAAMHLNFRAASAKVALSPAAFSERIRRLEDLLGERLFERTTRRVELTSAGSRLLPQARATLAAAEACVAAVRRDDPLPFTLAVGTRYELGLSWLVPAVDELKAARPERSLNLFFSDNNELLRRLDHGLLDAMVSSVRLTRTNLEYALLHEELYVFCASPSLVAPPHSPDDAPRHRLIDVHGDLPLFRYFLDARPPGELWAFHDVELMGTIAAIRARVMMGVGVAVLPHYYVKPQLESGELIALCPDTALITDHFRMVWRAGHARTPALRELADTLRARPLK